jgi:hypothetical protein
MTPEGKVKTAFVKDAKQYGLTYINLIFTGSDGDPDKLALPKGGPATFVEFKSPTGKLSPEQMYKIALYRGLGYPVFVIDCEHDARVLAYWLANGGLGWPDMSEESLMTAFRKRFV